MISEQYPKGLGHTVGALLEAAPAAEVVEKVHFSCVAADCLPASLLARHQVIVCGMETHVCVLQTVLGLLALADLVGELFVGQAQAGGPIGHLLLQRVPGLPAGHLGQPRRQVLALTGYGNGCLGLGVLNGVLHSHGVPPMVLCVRPAPTSHTTVVSEEARSMHGKGDS